MGFSLRLRGCRWRLREYSLEVSGGRWRLRLV